MIHAYLIQIKEEDGDENNRHGLNFIIKMSDINRMTKLNITVSQIFKMYFSFAMEKRKLILYFHLQLGDT